jgi:iron complex outermembrane recepter protein
MFRPRPPHLAPGAILLLVVLRFCAALVTAAESPPTLFDVPAGDATQSLKLFAAQARREIIFPAEAVAGIQTNRVAGTYAPRPALDALVAHTPLRVAEDPATGGFVVTRAGGLGAPSPARELPATTMKRKNPLAVLTGWLAVMLAPAQIGQAADQAAPAAVAIAGTLTGTVSNSATHNLLEGVKIEVPQLGLSALTDGTGRFVIAGVPPGQYELVVSYIGLDTVRTPVAVTAGQRTVRDFDLTTGIYQMQAFTVTGEREGEAAAITAQRNSPNLQEVVAMDSYGNLPNMSASEVVMRLPGVAGDPSDEGLAYYFNVRGMAPALNTVTVDGGLMPSIGASRSFELQSITGTMFDQLELTKGHTPDKGADSLGGTLNMRTRSPLNMKEKRRITYSATVRIAPSFTDQTPERAKHRSHPLLNLGYQEVFDVFGGQRNLGVALNLFYSENAVGGYRTDRDYQNTFNSPAYMWSFSAVDNYNNRKQASINLKTDYRYSFNTKFSAGLLLNDNQESYRRTANFRAWTGTATTVPSATTGIVPGGFTDRTTTVRPTASSNVDITNNGPNGYNVRTYQFNLGAEHDYGPLDIDYSASLARTGLRAGNGTGGYLTQRVSNIGWILDRTEDDLNPRFIQTAGPDISNPTIYRPIANGLGYRPNTNTQHVRQARANLSYKLPTSLPLTLKTGASWREHSSDLRNMSHQWNFVGTGPLPTYPSTPTYFSSKTGLMVPRWDPTNILKEGVPIDPSLWREDVYFYEALKYTGTRGVTEGVTAGYVQAQGKLGTEGLLGRTGFLGGVRTEKTDIDSYGYVRNRFGTTTAERTADPVGAAARDYADNRREIHGSYTKSFPSLHLTHDVTKNLKARVSWSTSFGRAGMTNFMPNETVNETARTVTVNNPSLLPQTAKNWDADLEYYFEPVGRVSVGWFHKTIRDYIITGTNAGIIPGGADNGFDGDYEGFTRLTAANAGTAIVQGWEFSYGQQFTFLPGLLRGLSASANYTLIDTHGNFGGRDYRKTGEVPGFIPRAANVTLSWRYRKFSTRVLYNFTGEHINSFSATSPALNEYVYNRRTTNVGLVYQLRPAVSLTCDVTNIFNEPYRVYIGTADRMGTTIINFVTVTFGVSGRF